MNGRTAVVVVALLGGTSLTAAEVGELEVSHEAGIYSITMIFTVAASISAVRAVLTDYAHLSRLNPAIVESAVLPSSNEKLTRVRTRTEDCILIFCADITRVEDVSSDGAGGFQAIVVPGLSDLESGRSTWRFDSRRNATRVVFKSRMDPDFWIPPLIGPLLIKSRLRSQLETTVVNVERLASQPE